MPDLVRVSTILSPFSGLSKIDPEVLKKAAERGTRVHNSCDAIAKNLGHFYGADETVDGYVKSFEQWYKPGLTILKPQRFECHEIGLTGEVDGIYADDDGKLVLFDLKTPVSESKTWKMQLSAYAYLARKAGFDIKRIEIIKLSKTGGKPKIFEYEEDFDMFMHCFEVYKHFFADMKEEIEIDYL